MMRRKKDNGGETLFNIVATSIDVIRFYTVRKTAHKLNIRIKNRKKLGKSAPFTSYIKRQHDKRANGIEQRNKNNILFYELEIKV